jgi:riboflavin kinase/FMN adenylyltransferase
MHLVTWSQFLEEALLFGGKRSAMTVGVFDGVHRGHQPLIERIVAHNATTAAAIPVVVTFRQSHYKKNLISGKDYPGNILSFRQKLDIFESLGVSITIVIDFSESFRRMSGTDFSGRCLTTEK